MNPAILTTTEAVDPVFIFILGACLVLFLGIAATMAAFVIRYRRSRAPEPTSLVASNLWLEVVWTALPTLLVLAMFWYGWKAYLGLRISPAGALEVTATARMWSWDFRYPGGRTSPKLYVPVGTPVNLTLVSTDVNHGLFIPAFRVKRDVIPGVTNHAWFVADRAGSFDLFCSQFCGTGHSAMITTVEALPPAAFTAWLQEKKERDNGIDGRKLATEKGCLGCHSLDGSPGVGPTFKGIKGRTKTVLTDGAERTITVDDDYLRRSIHAPKADVVKGYQAIMPPFTDLTEDEMNALVEFIESVE